MMAAYHKRLTGTDRAEADARARPGASGRARRFRCSPIPSGSPTFGRRQLRARLRPIECHYFVNQGFFARTANCLREPHTCATSPARSSMAATTS